MLRIPRRYSHFVYGFIQSGLTCAIAALQTKSAARIAVLTDNLVGKRARMEFLRRIWPQDCRVYVLRPFQMPSDGLHVESARPFALTQLNTSLFLLRRTALGRIGPRPFRISKTKNYFI